MRHFVAVAGLAIVGCSSVPFHATPPAAPHARTADAEAVYAPYQFLIGEWNVAPASGGPVSAIARFRWGPGQSYIWFTVDLSAGGREVPHLEGMFVFNGARKDLDMLMALDQHGARAQEQGRLYVEADGTVVRDIMLIGRDGRTGRFRQTFRREPEGRIRSATLRETPGGWTATFPGSDDLVLTPRG